MHCQTEASPNVVTGQSCLCSWPVWYLQSLSQCRPWIHLEFLVCGNNVLFYSEDVKPKALTKWDGWFCSVGHSCCYLELGLDVSLLCVTVLFNCPQWLQQRVPASVLTDKAKVPTFLLLCRSCKPGVTHEVVPKMKPTRIYWSGHGWCWLVDWMEKGLPMLCYPLLKPQLRPWAASSGLNWFCSLSFSPLRAFSMYSWFSLGTL